MIDALVLNYYDACSTIDCVNRLVNCNEIGHVLIVDNCSSDDSVNELEKICCEKVHLVVSDHNGGYGAGNNVGIKRLRDEFDSRFVLLCNLDTIIDNQTIASLENFLANHNEYAIAAPIVLNSNMEKQFYTACRIPSKKEYILSLDIIYNRTHKSFYYSDLFDDHNQYRTVGTVSGSLFMMDVSKMFDASLYDENIFLFCEEVTLGIKLQKKGYKVALLTEITFIHNHSVSINKSVKSDTKKQKLLIKSKLYVIKKYYQAKWYEYILANILAYGSIAEAWLISLTRRA